MKRILCALLGALLLLTLTACGGKKPAEDPSVQPPVEQPDTPDTPDPPAPSEAEQSLADLRETIRAAGAVLGCAYLGSTGGEESADLTALLKASPYTYEDSVLVKLSGFGASSIDLLVSAYLRTADMTRFLQMQNDLYLDLMDVMQKNGVDFAFPSTTVYLEKNSEN